MSWIAFAVSAAVVIAGFVVLFTLGSLLAAVLIIGGFAGLGWAVVPAGLDRIVGFLSTGSIRRRS